MHAFQYFIRISKYFIYKILPVLNIKKRGGQIVRRYLFIRKVLVSSKVKILPTLLFIQYRNTSDFDFFRYAAFFFSKNKSFLRKPLRIEGLIIQCNKTINLRMPFQIHHDLIAPIVPQGRSAKKILLRDPERLKLPKHRTNTFRKQPPRTRQHKFAPRRVHDFPQALARSAVKNLVLVCIFFPVKTHDTVNIQKQRFHFSP